MEDGASIGMSGYLSARMSEVCVRYRGRVLSAGSARALWSMLDCCVADWLLMEQDRHGDCAGWVCANFSEFSGEEVLRGSYSSVLYAGECGELRQAFESVVVLCGCRCVLECLSPCVVYAVGSEVELRGCGSVKVRASADSSVLRGGVAYGV